MPQRGPAFTGAHNTQADRHNSTCKERKANTDKYRPTGAWNSGSLVTDP